MTKSSKLIATLGVVAGLGVAALPLGSVFASQTISGNVQVDVEVLPAIAMTIEGNNDDDEHTSTAATGVSTYAPNGLGTNEDFDGYDATEGTAYNSSALQLSSSYTSLLPNDKVDGDATNGFGSTITVYTNNSTGYTLAVKDTDGTTLDLTNANGDTIEAGTSITEGTANWAYQLQQSDGTEVQTPAYAEITGSDVTLVTRTTETSGGSESFVGYGVSTSEDQPTGVYTNTITYTATTRS